MPMYICPICLLTTVISFGGVYRLLQSEETSKHYGVAIWGSCTEILRIKQTQQILHSNCAKTVFANSAVICSI